MKAHARIRFNIYINIDAIGAAGYFLRVFGRNHRLGLYGSISIKMFGCISPNAESIFGSKDLTTGT